ncbi:putative baseplate assembly protein [Umezawaea endophytica]|uniref:Baseplate assembly protein n=1 Tax=Umezawaea endophytica TaxID=1654476 RepID=A0A9X3A0L3_9PSEU|nr:putative baseplate assembly protein [Umezawaea endophytica]MCS7477118.1 putative baseplate assembly protein [Umezawaea endophytica]
MALPAPDLDTRRFADLVEDAHRMVRGRFPEWNDQHPSDPGVTLIETFAFMVDQLVYRLNRVPDRLHVKFLDLIGVRLFPPTPARTDVTFWLSAPATTALVVPAGTTTGTTRTETAESIVFTTEDDCVALPCELAAVRVGTSTQDVSEERTSALRTGLPVAVFGPVPADGDHLLLGLDAAVPRCAVRVEVEGDLDGVGVDPADPPLVWEAHDGEAWQPCRVLHDGTGGLSTAGAVVLDVPAGHRTSLLDGQRSAWLRARVVAPREGQATYHASPTVHRISACTVGVSGSAVNAEIVDLEVLDAAEGVAGQVFALAERPVLAGAGEVVLEVESDSGWDEWTRVEHFAASGPDDRHFVLDAAQGEIALGPVVRLADGTLRRHGAVPPHGAVLRVRRYATGGGALGNVAARTIRTLRTSIPFVADVENVRPATGGKDAETVEQARDRGGLALRTRGRAVTAQDYEVLAREAVPEVARVRCVPASGADLPPGTVKVLVVPSAAIGDDGRVRLADLVPPDAVLSTVAEHLDRVRLVGTTVLVEPPRYRGVTVVARLVTRHGDRAAAVRLEAVRALSVYLNPLPGGGPDGEGWPFGRAVRAGELHAVLHRVAGVELVEDVRLYSANPVTGERGPEAARIELDPHSLVFSFDHQVRVETR